VRVVVIRVCVFLNVLGTGRVLKERIQEISRNSEDLNAIVLDFSCVTHIDSSAQRDIFEIIEETRSTGIQLVFSAVTGPCLCVCVFVFVCVCVCVRVCVFVCV